MPSRKTESGAVGEKTIAIRWGAPPPGGTLSLFVAKRTVLGRDDDGQVCLPGNEVSRKHAEIVREGPIHILRDLGSRNGIFLNGVKVAEAPLSPGQIVRLGEWVGVVVSVPVDIVEPSPVFEAFAPNMAGGPVLRPILAQARIVAQSHLPTVVQGETGTGKEGLAKAIHVWSGRKGPFIAVNCAALVPSLAEAELFGYKRGAFTGAEKASLGFFRAAHGGTLLLDEIADLPEIVQAKLLRVLQEQQVTPLGEPLPVPIDVRMVAATQIPLSALVAERRFRADLCARLDGLTIALPPLRDRKEEIPFLFFHLLGLHSGGRAPQVEPRLIEQLCLYDWPFNLRELDFLVRRLLVFHGHEALLRRSHLPDALLIGSKRDTQPLPKVPTKAPLPNTPEFHRANRERDLAALQQALRQHNGSVGRAAAAVGISRARAYRLMDAGAPDDLSSGGTA